MAAGTSELGLRTTITIWRSEEDRSQIVISGSKVCDVSWKGAYMCLTVITGERIIIAVSIRETFRFFLRFSLVRMFLSLCDSHDLYTSRLSLIWLSTIVLY